VAKKPPCLPPMKMWHFSIEQVKENKTKTPYFFLITKPQTHENIDSPLLDDHHWPPPLGPTSAAHLRLHCRHPVPTITGQSYREERETKRDKDSTWRREKRREIRHSTFITEFISFSSFSNFFLPQARDRATFNFWVIFSSASRAPKPPFFQPLGW
jgi:hypothetical protein